MEDEEDMRNLYSKFLIEMGFDVKAFAKNGKEAVEKFKIFTEKPDIIIMDYKMPEKNGIDAAREILKIDSKIKIIMISADSTIKKDALSVVCTDNDVFKNGLGRNQSEVLMHHSDSAGNRIFGRGEIGFFPFNEDLPLIAGVIT